MSDDYQVPTSVPSTNPTQAPNPYSASGILGDGPAIKYLCGDCNASVMLKRGDPIRCKECGHRVLYKERTSSLRRDDWLLVGGVDGGLEADASGLVYGGT
ncbi:predicted protein [Sclerotinia sclerotiorum 1980 UF-70]|uniref:Metallothionein-I gene transcription activator n=1 Tax=Sclerotinia sclerotiorum (strain ATCC 18683 / 1980 / Ss-1) TaxID=665079 RepID=A7EN27_SCLS1|nr:predicted protein [Sclerotinia sclerotiorum 1980 UF-70]EDO04243.1 predicted protein [Sclerotinia sclerotiorum 1980 UF-70]